MRRDASASLATLIPTLRLGAASSLGDDGGRRRSALAHLNRRVVQLGLDVGPELPDCLAHVVLVKLALFPRLRLAARPRRRWFRVQYKALVGDRASPRLQLWLRNVEMQLFKAVQDSELMAQRARRH